MKNFTTCICIMGLSGIAAADVVMDQIGDMDGTGIADNIMASQDFESAYDVYDVVVADNFSGDGSNIDMVEMVMGGWNGFVDPSSVAGYTANLYSGPDAAGATLVGDIASSYVDAADATVSADWMGANFLVGMGTDLASAVGDQLVGVVPSNDFATGGQTGCADSNLGDTTSAIQANPGGGFGFGPWQEAGAEGAYRLGSSVAADPCTLPLPAVCAADVDGDGTVAVSDVLEIIGQWGMCGDGTFRPSGDVAPMPNGDCCVTVADVLAVVGSWGADCTVYGACCYGDGMCDTTSMDDCSNGGGAWSEGYDCADISCSTASCCMPDDSCADLTSDACAAMGGDTGGDGTACATTDCTATTPGDECADAIPVVDGANLFDTTDMTAGGPDPDETQCDGTYLDWGASQDGWYSYVATGGLTTFDTCDAGSYDTSMVLYEGTCDNQVACNGDAIDSSGCQPYSSEIANYDCTAGETYYIRIGAWNGDGAGPGTLNINPPATGYGACCFPNEDCVDANASDCDSFGGTFQGDGTACGNGMCEAPAGDECANALVALVDVANPFDTSLATPSTPDPDEAMCAGQALDWGTANPDVWFEYVPSASGVATFSTCDTGSFDTSMVIYGGTCDNQIACNGDADDSADGAGGACQAWYSRIDNVPVTGGESYYIRIGGWDGGGGAETGPGTLYITAGADAVGACCMSDGSCMDLNAADCAAAGGAYDGSNTCASASCPQPFACPAGADQEGDPCQVTGTEEDSNCGMNCDPAVFGNLTLGVPLCGNASVMADIGTRDTDWYYNAELNAGGDFTLSAASSGSTAGLAFGIVDNVALAFVYVDVTSTEGSLTFSLGAGDYSVFCAQNSFDSDGSCGSGQEDYWVLLEGAAATTGACCMADETCQDLSATDCDAAGGTYNGGTDCSVQDCTVGACPAGEIADCNGACCPESWVGDGYCDDGAYTWNGIPIYLNCAEFNCDGGDCTCAN